MTQPNIFVQQIHPSKLMIERSDVFRLMGVQHSLPLGVDILIEDSIAEVLNVASPRACFIRLPLTVEKKSLSFGNITSWSRDLGKRLHRCQEVIVFASTIGIGVEQLLARTSRLSPARSAVMDAAGSAVIESWCDVLCRRWSLNAARDGLHIQPRFSPGYGDLPLEIQKDIFRLLDCERRIGLTLTESLMMVPSKSVTAIVGLADDKLPYKKKDCATCMKQDCVFRK